MTSFHPLAVVGRGSGAQNQVDDFFFNLVLGKSNNAICLCLVARNILIKNTFRNTRVNLYNAGIFVHKPWRPNDFFQFEIIENVIVRFSLSLLIHICYGSTAIMNI